MSSEALTSYEWWQQSGWAWYAEVRRRRLSDDVYDRQEAFLSDFFHREAQRCTREEGRPLRVLEYGCGFGRHVGYLHRLDGLEVYGCDQSQAMLDVAGTLLYGRFPDLRGRLTLVEPDAPLPFGDASFDIVFTVSVLLHVPPESVAGRVAELRRVARGVVMHLEPPSTPSSHLWDSSHQGCWLHDLLGAHLSAGPCAVDVDADRIDPRAVVYRVAPATESRLDVLVGGERRSGLADARAAMVEATLNYARRTYDQMTGQMAILREQARGVAEARQEARRLQALQEHWQQLSGKPLFRAAYWFHMHPVAERLLSALVLPLMGGRRLVLRLLGKRAAAPAAPGQPAATPAGRPAHKEEGDRAHGY